MYRDIYIKVWELIRSCLNPCFIGMYRDSVIDENDGTITRLNPCFIGMYRDKKKLEEIAKAIKS